MTRKSLIGLGIVIGVLSACFLATVAGAVAGGVFGYWSSRQAAHPPIPSPWEEVEPPALPEQERPEERPPTPQPWTLEPFEMPAPWGWSLNAALITEVTPDSPADEAGLESGDIIIAVDNKGIDAENDLSTMIQVHKPGDEVVLTALRPGDETQIKEIEVTLGKDQDEEGEVLPYLGVWYRTVRIRMPTIEWQRYHRD